MENRNRKKALAIYRWTMKKYLHISIAYWILLILSLPLAELLAMQEIYFSTNQNIKEYIHLMMEPEEFLILFTAVAIIFSTILSFIGFSYMHNKRCVDFFGSLPVSRRTSFYARYLAVVTLTILPFVLVGFIGGLLTLTSTGFLNLIKDILLAALVVIANTTMIAFMSLCCGTVVDVVISYLALNTAYPILMVILNALPMNVIPGLDYSPFPPSVFTFFCPVAAAYTGIFGEDTLLHSIWWIVITAVLVLGCHLICKKRKAETAQNAFTFSLLSDVIKFIFCFAAGSGLGWIFSFIGSTSGKIRNEYIWFTIGMTVGIMVTNLLLHLIFYKGLKHYAKSLVECGVVACSVLAFLLIVATGFFGYDTYLPGIDRIQEISISETPDTFYVDGVNLLENFSKNEEDIRTVLDYHEEIIRQCDTEKWHGLYPITGATGSNINFVGDENYEDYVKISYRLKDGTTVQRVYSYGYPHLKTKDFPTELARKLRFGQSVAGMFQAEYLEDYLYIDQIEDKESIASSNIILSETQRQKLLTAIKKDCKTQHISEKLLVVDYDYQDEENLYQEDTKYILDLSFQSKNSEYIRIRWKVSEKDTETLAVMKEEGILNVEYRAMDEWMTETLYFKKVPEKTKTIYFSMPKDWDANAQVWAVPWESETKYAYAKLQSEDGKCEKVSDSVWKYEMPVSNQTDRIMFYQVLDLKVNCTGRVQLPSDNKKNLLQTSPKKGATFYNFPKSMYEVMWTKFD